MKGVVKSLDEYEGLYIIYSKTYNLKHAKYDYYLILFMKIFGFKN